MLDLACAVLRLAAKLPNIEFHDFNEYVVFSQNQRLPSVVMRANDYRAIFFISTPQKPLVVKRFR